MKKLLIILVSIIALSGCGESNCIPAPTKVTFIKVGFKERDVYMRVEGSSKFGINYDDLVQYDYENCDSYKKIATDVSYFSVISEEEYSKYSGVNYQSDITTTNIDSNITY